MDSSFDIISIGDSTIDLFMEIDPADTESVCSLHKTECLICFSYGNKIPVAQFARIPGVGNAANNAVGSSRLGLKTAIYTVIGSDKDSEDIKQVLSDEGIDTEFVVMESGKRSSTSVVLNYSGERTIFVYHEPRTYNLPPLPQSKWVYLTSVAKGHEVLHEQVIAFVKKANAKLAFNPGSYQLRDGLEKLKPVLEVTKLLSVNREEAFGLVGGDLEDTKKLFSLLKATGPEIIVITDGTNGSYASVDGKEIWQVGIPEGASIVERTGAGDAYSTAFLTAIIQGKEVPEAMIWGTMNATSVVGHIGAREGLLTRVKMEEFIGKYGGSLKARMF